MRSAGARRDAQLGDGLAVGRHRLPEHFQRQVEETIVPTTDTGVFAKRVVCFSDVDTAGIGAPFDERLSQKITSHHITVS